VPFSRAHGYSPKLPEMLALNPKGQVPVLVDGALAVYDSTIILECLEESHPLPPRPCSARISGVRPRSRSSLHAWLARMNARPSVRDEVAGLLAASARA
jgi:Glutathione S-transferase, N-terminal domain